MFDSKNSSTSCNTSPYFVPLYLCLIYCPMASLESAAEESVTVPVPSASTSRSQSKKKRDQEEKGADIGREI